MINALLAQSQFGPSSASFILLPLMIAGPFALLALTLQSIFRGGPTPVWLLGLVMLGNVSLAYFVWTIGPLRGLNAFWMIWWFAAVVSQVLLPVVMIMEGSKRNWLSR